MKKLFTLMLVLPSIGCASIVHQTTQQVPVSSDPTGASVTVACGDVYNDPRLVTPAVVTVHRKPNHCMIGVAKEGYRRVDVNLKKTMSGWYAANLLIGGIIGFIVDGANGAMWNRVPDRVDVKLEQSETSSSATQ